jgi:hypothetical protein
MWIRKAVAWFFDVSDRREHEVLRAARELDRRCAEDPSDGAEAHLYGEAEAIRVLYQTSSADEGAPKPPRPKRGHRIWIAKQLDALTPSMPAGARA